MQSLLQSIPLALRLDPDVLSRLQFGFSLVLGSMDRVEQILRAEFGTRNQFACIVDDTRVQPQTGSDSECIGAGTWYV